ncbi:MAG: hypothetical protein WA049_06320 [Ferribacterium limneticum]
MASEVDLCNLALSRLGDSATVSSIDPPEGSAQAEHCSRFYPIARDSLLEMHDWKFATRRTTLSELTVDSFNWAHSYAEPNGALRIVSVLDATQSAEDESYPFAAESGDDGAALIYTNLQYATVRYVARVTDTTKFSPLFADALAWLLASHMAGPLIKGTAGQAAAKACYANFNLVFSYAKVSDANQRKSDPTHTPGWIADR